MNKELENEIFDVDALVSQNSLQQPMVNEITKPSDIEEGLEISETTGEAIDNDDLSEEEQLNFIKRTITKSLRVGANTLEKLEVAAKHFDHPMAYDSIGKLIKSMAESAEKLLTIQEKTEKIKEMRAKNNKTEGSTLPVKSEGNPVPVVNNTQNNVIVASTTAELINVLKGIPTLLQK